MKNELEKVCFYGNPISIQFPTLISGIRATNIKCKGDYLFKIVYHQWYHLLPEQQSLNKHFRCHCPQQQKQDNYEDIKQITNLNKDLIGMEQLRIRVQRTNDLESYGFTITGNCPCMVNKVDASKQAFMSELRLGDYLSSINNKNVSRAV